MMKRLFPLFLALLLTACAKDDLTTGGVAAVPIRISVMTGNAATGRTPGDPGEAETYTLPKVAYIYLLAYDGANETGNLQLLMPAGADVGYGWVYINKVGLRCIRRSLAVPPAGAKMPQNVLSLFRAPPYAAGRGGGCCREGAWHNGGPFGNALFFRVSVLCGLSLYVIVFVLIIMPSVCA